MSRGNWLEACGKYYKDYVFTHDKGTLVRWVGSEKLSDILYLPRGYVFERDQNNLWEFGEFLEKIVDDLKFLSSSLCSGHV